MFLALLLIESHEFILKTVTVVTRLWKCEINAFLIIFTTSRIDTTYIKIRDPLNRSLPNISWDWDYIGIRLGTKHVTYQKLVNFM